MYTTNTIEIYDIIIFYCTSTKGTVYCVLLIITVYFYNYPTNPTVNYNDGMFIIIIIIIIKIIIILFTFKLFFFFFLIIMFTYGLSLFILFIITLLNYN